MDINHDNVTDILLSSGVTIDTDELTNESSLAEAGLDSLDISNFFLCLEESYGIHVPDEDIEGLDSINVIVEYLKNAPQ